MARLEEAAARGDARDSQLAAKERLLTEQQLTGQLAMREIEDAGKRVRCPPPIAAPEP